MTIAKTISRPRVGRARLASLTNVSEFPPRRVWPVNIPSGRATATAMARVSPE